MVVNGCQENFLFLPNWNDPKKVYLEGVDEAAAQLQEP